MPDDSKDFEPITKLSLSSLDGCDVALMNLRAARGLKGTSSLDEGVLLAKLDEWASRCNFEIWRHLYRIERQISQPPTEFSYRNSLGRLCCWYMLQVLQEDCGVAYHPDRKFNPDFCNPEDVFIHGILNDDGKGGTCASMPVVYVAVGQRLGLPVHLVQTRGHLFFRWDDPKGTLLDWGLPPVQIWIPPDRFNVEGSGEGIAFHPDAYYRDWPEKWTDAEIKHGIYLRTLNNKEILADFLIQRGECFFDAHDWNNCLKSIYFARQLAPDDPRYEWLHAQRTKQLHEWEESNLRVIEQQQENRRKLESMPGVWGHSQNCCCHDCDPLKRAALHLEEAGHGENCGCWQCKDARQTLGIVTGAPGHTPHCFCNECDQYREMAKFGPVPPHGMTCGCWECSQTRSANHTARMGHSLNCLCGRCTQRRNQFKAASKAGHPEHGRHGLAVSPHSRNFPRLPGT